MSVGRRPSCWPHHPLIWVVSCLIVFGGCATLQVVPDPLVPAITVQLQPDRPWTDTGIVVKRGERLFFTATGEVFWDARHSAAGPDGIKGIPGWKVGDGGLVGMVVGTAKILEVGARTELFADKNLRSRRRHSPPALAMPGDGRLVLGFKNFRQGVNQGGFDVKIQRAR